MSSSRREFLKSTAGTSLAGIAAVAGIATTTGIAGAATGAPVGAAPARRRRRSSDSHDMPRGMTLLSIRSEHGDTLGVKTGGGVLDVRRASPAAQNARRADRLFVDEAQITHGRLFANPGKIVCIGLNYREHAKEAGEKVPAIPILFNN